MLEQSTATAASSEGVVDSLASIAVFHDAELRNVMVDLLRQLKREHGSKIHVFVFSEAGKRFYQDQPEADQLFDTIESMPIVSTGSMAPLRTSTEDIAATATTNEQRFGTPYNQIIMTDRHIGRGFSPGGYFHPRSIQSEAAGYWQITQHLNDQFQFWCDQFESKKFTLVLNLQKIPSVVADHHGVPCRQLTQARIENLFYWSQNVHLETPELEAAFAAMPPTPPRAPKVAAYDQYGLNRAIAIDAFRFGKAIHGAIRRTWRHLLRRARGQKGGYRWRDAMRNSFRYWTQWRKLNRLPLASMATLKEHDYIFFALQEEPETTLTWQSPESLPQFSYIWQIARDLPAGKFLAVKDHIFAIGRRPSEYYQQILDFKNVLLIDPLESGIEVMQNARAAATVSSTVCFEAAFVGKPVVSCGQHNLPNFLDHVHVAHAGASLVEPLRQIFAGEFDTDKSHADGAKLHESLRSIAFDFGDYDMNQVDRYDPAIIPPALEALKRSLR